MPAATEDHAARPQPVYQLAVDTQLHAARIRLTREIRFVGDAMRAHANRRCCVDRRTARKARVRVCGQRRSRLHRCVPRLDLHPFAAQQCEFACGLEVVVGTVDGVDVRVAEAVWFAAQDPARDGVDVGPGQWRAAAGHYRHEITAVFARRGYSSPDEIGGIERVRGQPIALLYERSSRSCDAGFSSSEKSIAFTGRNLVNGG